MVNRLWKQHFGRGIVESLDNFGRTGTPPSHPALLDWLAREFVARNWSMKAMHRLMMNSAAYRQSSRTFAPTQKIDPDNRLFSRMPLKRMEAEVLYDTLLFVADRLDARPFGPSDAVVSQQDGLVTPVEGPRGWRRAIYAAETIGAPDGIHKLRPAADEPELSDAPRIDRRQSGPVPDE